MEDKKREKHTEEVRFKLPPSTKTRADDYATHMGIGIGTLAKFALVDYLDRVAPQTEEQQ